MNMRKLWPVVLLGLVLTGCTSRITNLTPREHPRNEKNLYPFEVEFSTTQRSIKEDTLKAFVLIGLDVHPMQRMSMLTNRWETLIEIPPGENFIYYRYKFEYDYSGVPKSRSSSRLSPQYQFQVLDQ